MKALFPAAIAVLALTLGSGAAAPPIAAQSKAPKPASTQKIDEEYTRLIRENLQDPRITTELVDHLPASRANIALSTLDAVTARLSGWKTISSRHNSSSQPPIATRTGGVECWSGIPY